MIHHIRGILTEKTDGRIVVETGGIGYDVSVPDGCGFFSKNVGAEVFVYTAMLVKEDDVSLCGFPDRESLAMFRRLLTVSGVGAKAAMSVLSAVPYSELARAIVFGDADMLTRANGVGKKSAQRIILELKDKVTIPGGDESLKIANSFADSASGTASGGTSAESEAIEALIGLGYSRSEAVSAVASVAASYGDSSAGAVDKASDKVSGGAVDKAANKATNKASGGTVGGDIDKPSGGAVSGAPDKASGGGLSVEEYIRQALRRVK
jgi:Holliday junction DNA helicase RuvA